MAALRAIRWQQWAAALALVLLPAAASQQAAEEDLKAAFIYNFAMFTDWPSDWPAESGGLLTVCIHGRGTMLESLEGLNQKPVRGRQIAVRPVNGRDDFRSCHVLFVDSHDKSLGHLRDSLRGASVLTVTDDDHPFRRDAIITLTVRNSRVAFEINLAAARQARLAISSRLLRLAKTVH